MILFLRESLWVSLAIDWVFDVDAHDAATTARMSEAYDFNWSFQVFYTPIPNKYATTENRIPQGNLWMNKYHRIRLPLSISIYINMQILISQL